MYTDIVMDYLTNPRNMGEIENPDGIGQIGNPVCGDIMRITIRVKGEVLEDIKFKTFGCGAAIATSSAVTDMMRGKTVQEALALTNKMVAERLGGLPANKMHCSNLAADALHLAIKDFLTKNPGAVKGIDPSKIIVKDEHDHGDDDAEEGAGCGTK